MILSVLSGKGGTGKTLVSVNLAAANKTALYMDCDVEEPNGHLFFKPENNLREDVTVKMPVIDPNLCTGCRKCVSFCKFNALAFISKKVKVFEEVCHSCGGCALICPEKAIIEKESVIGQVHSGHSEGVKVVSGFLNTGEASGVPIIKEVLKHKDDGHALMVIDCPPGSACVVMESIKDADYCVLVAEPTLFGVHNLAMVYELVKLFQKPHGVILNKCNDGENPSEEFCVANQIKILGKIPFDHTLGRMNSNGLIVSRENESYQRDFEQFLKTITQEVQNEAITHPER